MKRKVTHDESLFNRKRLDFENPLVLMKQCVSDTGDIKRWGNYTDSKRRVFRPRISLTESINKKITNPDISEKLIYFDCYIQPLKRVFDLTVLERKEKKLREALKEITEDRRRVKGTVKYLAPEDLREGEKGEQPFSGETITFYVRKLSKNDDETIQSFQGIVQEVVWGSTCLIDEHGAIEDRPNENLGLVLVKVKGTFDRSLIIQSAPDVRRNSQSVAA